MTNYLLFILVPIPMILLISYLIILFRHRKAGEQIKLLKQRVKPTDCIMPNIKMKFVWSSGMKAYFSFITNCDVYLNENYCAIIPFQTFPFKAYHKPIVLTNEKSRLKKMYQFLNIITPDKVIFKEVIKSEVEIQYHENHNKYQIWLKGLTMDDKANLERIRAYC